MKKLTALLLAGFMALSLTACSENNTKTENKTSAPENTVNNASTSQETNGGNTDNNNNAADKTETENGGTGTANEDTDSVKILVAYFSATNTTEGVAKIIAESLNADLYEIVPENPYTSADLNYNDKSSRSTTEMNDPNCRPAISGSVDDMGKYDIVFVGYPIWWGDAPRIISTFVESYDFAGKTVVPFCTSASSGVGSSASNIEKLAGSGTWLSGTRLNGNASKGDIVDWINGLGLNVTAE